MQRFGSWTVIGVDPDPRYRLCVCDCGTQKRVKFWNIKTGLSTSCGCVAARNASARAHLMHEAKTTHGKSGSRAYGIWCGMKDRCGNPNSAYYAYYGGRGVKVCDRWRDSFENFLADMGEPGPQETIERIDNDGGYEPSNCKWATRKEQQNNRRVSRKITHNGRTMTAKQWSEEAGIHINTLIQRLDSGLSAEELFSTERRVYFAGLALGGKANGARLRALTHCKNGHEFTAENTSVSKKTGARRCKTCHRMRQKLLREAKSSTAVAAEGRAPARRDAPGHQ